MNLFQICDIGSLGGLMFIFLMFFTAVSGAVYLCLLWLSHKWFDDMERMEKEMDRVYSERDK